ncbi:MAG: TVP38/TMEM64 family protein [Haloferacaceae archaeon]
MDRTRLFSSPGQRRRFLAHLVAALAVAAAAWYALDPHLDAIRDPAAIRATVAAFGPVGVVAFVALHVVQIIVVPIPGQAMGVAAGYLFGAGPGLVYTVVGVTLGSYVAFALARRLGRPYVERVFAADVVDAFDAAVDRLGVVGITVLVVVPGLPDDVVCFACGLSDLTPRQFLVVVLVGRTPAYALAVLSGANLADQRLYRGVALLFVLVLLSAAGYLRRDALTEWVVDRFGG